uniref:Multidrug ABC transporter permease n=1 Tax=Compsopogon caeruleus TaxID=31354 RepID=A0A1Z1XBC7_9RHOD|nr:multidrug ABC transporter permease [Compsopogon caeruleus]ARX96126.1 multidrug ABC transporter permease [Compsopogon caeruleus]
MLVDYSNTVLRPRPIAILYSNTNFYSNILQETYALSKRLFIQLKRRSSTFFAGIIQPLLWLILFGALFSNVSGEQFGTYLKYNTFLSAGVIVFTAFTGGLNSGLPIIFDREFGFFNRLLSSPLNSRFSIFIATSYFIIVVTLIQISSIILCTELLGVHIPNIKGFFIIFNIIFIVTIGITLISISLAFLLSGHIQLLALILVINLPVLFSSTALAPLNIMPNWLKIIASVNPLTYAIETIRYVYLSVNVNCSIPIIQTIWGNLSIAKIFFYLIELDVIIVLLLLQLLKNKFR